MSDWAARPTSDAEPDEASASPRALGPIEIHDDITRAATAWRSLEACCDAAPYQSYGWVAAWSDTVGRSLGIHPTIVVARDTRGEPLAVLPFGSQRRHGLTVGTFLGGRDANGSLGLFHPGYAWSRETIRALLHEVARRRGVDLFWLANQRHAWGDQPNPLALLGGQPAASAIHAVALGRDPEAFLQRLLSKSTRKRLRYKASRLALIGPVVHRQARRRDEASEILDAYFWQKAARVGRLGIATDMLSGAHRAFLEQACDPGAPGGPSIDLHALLCGDRIVATLGGAVSGSRLSGMFISFDADEAIARCSPGDLLLVEILAAQCRDGRASFDLGIGEARYKEVFCPEEELLFDQFIGVTLRGRAAVGVLAFLARQKRWAKQNPWAWSAIGQARRALAAVRSHAGL